MFALSELSKYRDITIQCHDNPDADAIASAFALHAYLAHVGIAAAIIYAGRAPISKPNLLEMVQKLDIPLRYAASPETFDTLIIVDGQYGAGNVTRFQARTIVVIDHHREEHTDFDLGVINFSLGSCATLVWDLMRKENFPFDKHPNVSTALYFGLYSDTAALSEMHHPLDKDMRDALVYSRSTIKRLQNANLSLNELSVAGGALTQHVTQTAHSLRYAIFKSEPCDPNILGFISDLALQVDSIDVCVVYNLLGDGAKLSIRSCAREVMAADFAEFLARDVGSGGGHMDKAGGYIRLAQVAALPGAPSIDDYIHERALAYFNSYDIVDAASHSLDVHSMRRYRKLKIPLGYARSTDMFPPSTPIMVRALEGDENIIASEDIYFMVGILGEAYPIDAAKFKRSYEATDATLDTTYSYIPTVRNRITGEVKEITPFVRACVALGEVCIYAQALKRDTKVFTEWNIDGYMYGRTGDYIVVRADDFNDVYIVRADIFYMTYSEISEVLDHAEI